MRAFLVRHAHANVRTDDPDDIRRPLSELGWRQAEAIVEIISTAQELYSSPATRCVQTLQPFARAAGIEIVSTKNLWEDTNADLAFDLLERLANQNSADATVALCSHGNIIPPLLEMVVRRGAEAVGTGCEKGSVWELTHNGNVWTKATYLGLPGPSELNHTELAHQ